MSLHHPRSPSPQMLQNHINSPHINEYSHFMYNSVQEDPDVRKQRSKNSFAAYRSPPFNAYNGNPRQAPSNFAQSYSSDLYSQHIDTLSPNRFDLGEEAQTYVGIDQYGNNETGSMLLQSPPAPAPQPQQPPYSHAPYLAGLTHMQSQQVTYGPHLPGPLNQPSTATATMPTNNGTTQSGSQQQEEISTIFVVGFPDDMQEREFQNMFTFSAGFEAATLKIPNKELTSYGSSTSTARSTVYPQGFSGATESYNQAGVVVDNGRDGNPSSWPVSSDDGHYLPSAAPQPPRKQIIGFAKFRTREEALEARDILQGRRVDIEKGAVLKAEMAKKNLHTKRGPVAAGPSGVPSSGDSAPAAAQIAEPMTARERELGTLGAMGFGRRDRGSDDEDRDRQIAAANLSTRGARERAEEDERERERRRQEKDAARLRSAAFDAFHSVPAQVPRSAVSNPLANQPSAQGVWGMTAKETGSRQFIGPISVDASPRPPSPPNAQSSPTKSGLYSRSIASEESSGHQSGSTFSPPMNSFGLPSHSTFASRPRPFSPINVDLKQYSVPSSSASSVDGSGVGSDNEAKNVTDGSTSPQIPSPASAGGGVANVGPRGNPGDQNPPINTLYVGNLPSSPPAQGYPPTYLEDELRELFGRRPGYRKLCFRQKNNGPMCFVEFEDVRHATKALQELHGHTLNGLVKSGGIRLSYSKNPLGVRTPTSATGSSMQQQQPYNFKELHSAPPSSSFFPPESFSRQISQSDHHPRRDTMQSYQYTTPAPRFAASTASSPTATTTHYATSVTQIPSHVSSFPRSIHDSVANSTFAPFRMSAADQFGADLLSSNLHSVNERFGHSLSTPANGIEASRAG